MKTRPLSFFYSSSVLLSALLFFLSCQEEKQLKPLEEKTLYIKPKTVTMKFTKYCPSILGHQRSDFFLLNLSTIIENKRINIDLDSDGIPNYRDNDLALNIGFNKEDSNLDGYGDLLIYYAGFLLEQQGRLPPCADPSIDSVFDGLNDCEEKVLGTNSNNFDSDGDGIPDYLEVRYGLEPATSDGQDAILDPDSDGLTNIQEIRSNTPLYETNDSAITKMAIGYDNSRRVNITNAECYDYTITNIPIADSSSGNLIRIYFMEKNSINLTTKYMHVYDINIPRTTEDGAVLEYDYQGLTTSVYFVGTGN